MKDAFCFMLKAFFFLRDLHFCPKRFGYVEKQLDKKSQVDFKIYDVTDWTTNNYNTHYANISRGKKTIRRYNLVN